MDYISERQVRANRALVLQLGACVAAMGVFLLIPPDQGRMLLLPMPGADAAAAVRIAIAQGSRLVARGPLPRSVIVAGEASRLTSPMLAAGIVVVAAPAAGCGETGL